MGSNEDEQDIVSYRDNDSSLPLLEHEVPASKTRRSRMATYWLVSLSLLLILNVALLLINYLWFMNGPADDSMLSYSPASQSVKYEYKAGEHAIHGSSLGGAPTQTNIKAWEDLIQPMFFGATEQELLQAGVPLDDSAKLAEGGYVAALGVYHEIHCLRQLRLYVYNDRFYPNLTDENIQYLHHHLDRCLETIRVSLMCSADLSIYTFKWLEQDPDRPHPRTHAVRKCANWGSVESWAMSRKVPLDPMLLRPGGTVAHIQM